MAAGTYSIDNINIEASQFLHVSIRDGKSRTLALQKTQDQVEAWLDGYGSPPSGGAGLMIGMDSSLGRQEFMQQLVPELLRLSLCCPYQDVRDKSAEILKDIEERAPAVKVPRAWSCGPSRFIPRQDIVPVDTAEEDNQVVYIESFLQNNRLEHLHQVMGCHPKYLEAFMKTQNFLLREDGPLPFTYRHYIAIMAAARHQCLYLVRLHAHDFLLQGGDAAWLKGLDSAPTKLRSLVEINNILAHRPWLLKKEDIEKLARGKNDTWSMSELTQAMIIMSHFHTLCSFIYGCGITPEIDQGGCTLRPASCSGDDESEDYASDSSTGGELNANVLEDSSLESLMERMRMLTEGTRDEGPTQEEMLKRFQSVENQSAEISVPNKEKTSSKKEVVRFVTNSDFTYSDFAKRAPELDIPTFRVQDYSWEDHGFSLVNSLYGDIGSLLEDRFNIAVNLTYYTMGNNREVDTSAFRQAIWYYIHCMYGIRHDDYDYAQVNVMLERNLKTYIKTITCYPERITKKDYESVMREFKHSEKVHVNFMITEARMQAELLYALRVVNRYITQ